MIVYGKNKYFYKSAFSADGAALTDAYEVNGESVQDVLFRDAAIVSELPYYNYSALFQGACTDGEYIYQISFSDSSYTIGYFIKYKIADGTASRTAFNSSIPYNHGNDMAYNPNNGHIYVAAMSNDGAVMELDTDFNYIETHYLLNQNGNPYAVWGLCFDQNTGHFLSELSGTLVGEYDSDFRLIKTFAIPNYPTGSTAQGFETDGEFLYRVFYGPNLIDVITMDGKRYATVELPLVGVSQSHPVGEPETLMYNWTNGEYYVNTNFMSQLFYALDLKM